MTRETKVGMAVACSFLSLVVAVVVLRMRHGDEPDSTTAGSGLVAQGKNGATPGKDDSATVVRPNAEKPASDKEPRVLQVGLKTEADPLPVSDPPGPPAGNQGIPTPAATTAAVKDVLPGVPSIPAAVQPEVSPPPIPAGRPPEVAPPPVVTPPAPAAIIPAPSAPPAGVGAGPNAPPAKPKEPVAPPAVAAAPADTGLPTLPPPPTASAVPPAPPGAVAPNKKLSPEEEQQQRLKELMNQVAASGQTAGPPAPTPHPATTVPVPVPGSGPEKGPLAQGNDLLPPPPVAGLPPPPAPAPLPGPASTAKVEPPPGNPLVPPAAAVVKDPGPAAPAAVKPPAVALNGQLAPMDPPGTGATRLPGMARPGDVPAAVAMGPISADDAPPGSRSPQAPSAATGRLPAPPPPAPASLPGSNPAPLPPLGAPPAGSSAPIAVPVPPPQPASSGPAKVQSYEVETHRVQPGDSTFADLSKKLYGSEKYAQALLQFNREYPLAGDNLKADPPRLEPGQPIYVPPTYVLEQPRYAAAPPPARPIASTPSPVSVGVPPPVAVAPPRQPVAPAVPAVGSTGPAPAAPSAAGTRPYTVQGNGEMLFEIARQTLGDGRRWSEIYRLNPDIRPELAIPGGTQLRLPADARVGS